ncbi:MAG TPA: PIN domain-containing protein [Candidatus Acidoferrum sp.]|jgi:predicted nucleic acid-binding protein|nr:PIN domain-containing protein [Candidatus Acidoferrum sp.]
MRYAAVLDACVLVPMPLCDTLLRLAEEPAVYRPVWSEQILLEVGRTLEKKLNRTPFQRERRLQAMRNAFPEAEVRVPWDLVKSVTCIPDPNDRHVVAAAILGSADAIVTFNAKHFPADCVKQYGLVCQTPDEFLVQQFDLARDLVLERLDSQAAALGLKRLFITGKLERMVPSFVGLVEPRIGLADEIE